MNQVTPEVHLKRAHGLITDVEKPTEEFRSSALQHSAQLDADQPFLQMMATGFRGKRQLAQQKSTLLGDLQLANDELDRAAALNRDATIETGDGAFGIKQLRALIPYLNGQLEVILGSSQKAKQLFANSIQLLDFPSPHYMLGLLYEDEYKPAEALREFERCLQLDPDGELSVPALREANAMKNYKKRFRGSWGAFFLLLIFFFPAAFVYLVAKWK
jgi:tetratricopeptide (TPR) repeat protein